MSNNNFSAFKICTFCFKAQIGELVDLSVSEEQLAIANAVLDTDTFFKVYLVDSDDSIDFDYNNEDFNETEHPNLFFK